MDAWRLLILLLLASWVAMAQDSEESTTTPKTVGLLEDLKNCTTSHRDAGRCVQRNTCDYGTPAVDFTLYAPGWYQSTCSPDEVCCPAQSIIAQNIEYSASNTLASADDSSVVVNTSYKH